MQGVMEVWQCLMETVMVEDKGRRQEVISVCHVIRVKYVLVVGFDLVSAKCQVWLPKESKRHFDRVLSCPYTRHLTFVLSVLFILRYPALI